MAGKSLQLAISAKAQITALLAQQEQDIFKRLSETNDTLGDLIDSLEQDFLSKSSMSPLVSTPTGSGNISNIGHSDIVVASQRQYMESLIELLHKKEAAMEAASKQHEQTLREIVSNHEQTIRFLASQKVPMPLSGRAD